MYLNQLHHTGPSEKECKVGEGVVLYVEKFDAVNFTLIMFFILKSIHLNKVRLA